MILAPLVQLTTDVPVQPDAPEARGWLLEELSKPEYARDPSLLQRFLEWFNGLFDDVRAPDLDRGLFALVIVVLVIVVALVAYRVAGPVRRSRKSEPSAVVLEDDDRTADQMRRAADAAAAAGDWATAVLERFRAIVRGMEERALVEERPGRTAAEAAAAGGERLPDVAADLVRAAHLFDDVCYGKRAGGPDADAALRTLDARVVATRPPRRPELVGAGNHAAAGAGTDVDTGDGGTTP